MPNANVTVGANSSFSGNGTVASLVNNGTVQPGASIGTITITGNYTQNAGGRLNIELNSAGQSDLLDITGNATLNGRLDLQFDTGSYSPGTTFTFIDADGKPHRNI